MFGRKKKIQHSIIRVLHVPKKDAPCKLYSICSCGSTHPLGVKDGDSDKRIYEVILD